MSKVLLVEEDPLIRATLARALERFGHDVLLAHGAREAISSIAVYEPDVVLAEHLLSGPITGSMLLEHVALMAPGCARVLMSGGNVPRATLKRGVHQVYLAKPFSIHVVAATLGDLDARQHMRAA